MPCAPCAGHKAAAQTPHRHAPGDGDRARAERRRRSGPAARAPQPPTAECRRPARPRRAASGGQAPPLGTRDSLAGQQTSCRPPPRSPHHGLGLSRPRSRRAAAAPPAAPTAAAAAAGARTITGARLAPPRPMVTRLAGLNPGCCPIARLLLACPRPRHLLPNGCLFLHTAHGGGASGRHRDAPVREQGRVHALLSACVHGLSPTNGRTDQSEWTAAGRYPIKTSPASKGGGSPGTTAGLANGGLVGGFPRLLGGDSLVSESCLVGNSCGRRFSRAFSQTPRTS